MSESKHILITDVSLRDGNHAIAHQLTLKQIACYCTAVDKSGVPIVEVGHGNGLGASSLQLGEAPFSDHEMLAEAKKHLSKAKLGIHVIPGFATINRDIKPALDLGVDVVRVASHCSEADITARHLSFVREKGKTAFGVLMMSHMLSPRALAEQALKMESYGAEAIIFMDSAGHFLPDQVTERVKALLDLLTIPVGFHAHNNLGVAIANSIAAVNAGASLLDGSARGFGAGSGNAQIEALIPVIHRIGHQTSIDLYSLLDAADLAEKELMQHCPTISSLSIVSGLSGVFSGFLKPVQRISEAYKVDPKEVFSKLGERKVLAGQEDLIIEVASEISNKRGSK